MSDSHKNTKKLLGGRAEKSYSSYQIPFRLSLLPLLVMGCSQSLPEASNKRGAAKSLAQTAKDPVLALKEFSEKMTRSPVDGSTLTVTKALPTPTSIQGVFTHTLEVNASGGADYVEIQLCHVLKGTCEASEKIAVTRTVLKPMDPGEIQVKVRACVEAGRSTSGQDCGAYKNVTYEQPENLENSEKTALLRERDSLVNQLKNLEVKVTDTFQKFVTESEECVKRDQKNSKIQSLRMGAQMVLSAGEALSSQSFDPGAFVSQMSPQSAAGNSPDPYGAGGSNNYPSTISTGGVVAPSGGGAVFNLADSTNPQGTLLPSSWKPSSFTSLNSLVSPPAVLSADPAVGGAGNSGGAMAGYNAAFTASTINPGAENFNESPEASNAVNSFGVGLKSFEDGNTKVQNFLGNIGLFEQAPPVKAVSLLTNTVFDLFTANKQVQVPCRAQEMAQNNVDAIQVLRTSLLSRLQIIDSKIQEKGIK